MFVESADPLKAFTLLFISVSNPVCLAAAGKTGFFAPFPCAGAAAALERISTAFKDYAGMEPVVR